MAEITELNDTLMQRQRYSTIYYDSNNSANKIKTVLNCKYKVSNIGNNGLVTCQFELLDDDCLFKSWLIRLLIPDSENSSASANTFDRLKLESFLTLFCRIVLVTDQVLLDIGVYCSIAICNNLDDQYEENKLLIDLRNRIIRNKYFFIEESTLHISPHSKPLVSLFEEVDLSYFRSN